MVHATPEPTGRECHPRRRMCRPLPKGGARLLGSDPGHQNVDSTARHSKAPIDDIAQSAPINQRFGRFASLGSGDWLIDDCPESRSRAEAESCLSDRLVRQG
jgi:hypothetical protein